MSQFLKSRWLDNETLDRLRGLLDEKRAIAKNTNEINTLQNERNTIYQREEQLRKNMAALSTTGDEAVLRKQVFTQLQTAENRLADIDKRVAALNDDNQQRQARIDAELQKLKVADTSKATGTPSS